MTTLLPPRNSEDSIDELSKLPVVSPTICFWEQMQGNRDQQHRDVGQDLPHGEEEGKEGKKLEEDQQQREGQQKEQPEEKDRTEGAKQKALRFLSILVLVAMVPAVWCSISEPRALVWRFSFLLCCASIIWSRRLDVTVSAATMFLVTFSGFMTALYLDAVLDHEIGVLIAHLNSHLAVLMLGYALAKHCQHNGLEVTPATAAPPMKLSASKENSAYYNQILAWCVIGMITVAAAARMAWVVWYRADYPTQHLGFYAFSPMSIALVFWSLLLGVVLLRGRFIGETRFTFLTMQLTLAHLLFFIAYAVLGEVGGTLVSWPVTLFWTGWFGYSLCVYKSFKHQEPEAATAVAKEGR